MAKTKNVTLSLSDEQLQKAKILAKLILGKENVSGLFGFLLEKEYKERNPKPE